MSGRRGSDLTASRPTVVVCEDDETSQELLEQSLRVLDSELVRRPSRSSASISRWRR